MTYRTASGLTLSESREATIRQIEAIMDAHDKMLAGEVTEEDVCAAFRPKEYGLSEGDGSGMVQLWLLKGKTFSSYIIVSKDISRLEPWLTHLPRTSRNRNGWQLATMTSLTEIVEDGTFHPANYAPTGLLAVEAVNINDYATHVVGDDGPYQTVEYGKLGDTYGIYGPDILRTRLTLPMVYWWSL